MSAPPPRSRRARVALLAMPVAVAIGLGGLQLTAESPAAGGTAPSAPTSSSSCPAGNPANTLALVSGTPQTAQLDTQFGSGLQVALANTNGCPVTAAIAGTPVTLTAPASGASAIFSASGSDTVTVGSDDAGNVAAAMLTANDTPGSYTITATSTYGTVTFSLTNTAAGLGATVVALAPTVEQATVGARYPQPLTARVLDANGSPVVGATVTFTLGAGGGTGASASGAATAGATFDGGSDQAAATTNGDGIATSPGFSANATSGTFTASASTSHVAEPASFALDNLAATAPSVTAVGSTHPSATVDTRYGQPLQIRVREPDGSPVVGATVTFMLGSSAGATGSSAGAGATFLARGAQATATTGAKGIATSPPLAANGVAGTFKATATVSGTVAVTQFTLRNRAGAPATVTTGVAARESATVGDRFAIALAVTVTDAEHNLAPRVEVTFTAPAFGASGTFATHPRGSRTVTVTTDAAGVAVAPSFIANGEQGGYVVMATVRHARPAAFALVNKAS